MKKASNHRKRHFPPGPCGIWFQTQQQLSSSKKGNDPTEDQNLPSQPDANTPSDKVEDMSFSPAWSSMQQALNIVTPYLPTWQTDSKQRFEVLRPHVPSQYVLLWEILQGKHDFTVDDPNRLLVLVHSVESHIHHNIWTVELKDETGVTIRAWMEPKYVQEQILSQHQEQSTIRPGVVWMLRKVGMIVVQDEEQEKVERMLLISGKQIERIWTPEEASQKEGDAVSQKEFLDFMEKRKAIASTGSEEQDGEAADDRADQETHVEEDVVEEDYVSTRRSDLRSNETCWDQRHQGGTLSVGSTQQSEAIIDGKSHQNQPVFSRPQTSLSTVIPTPSQLFETQSQRPQHQLTRLSRKDEDNVPTVSSEKLLQSTSLATAKKRQSPGKNILNSSQISKKSKYHRQRSETTQDSVTQNQSQVAPPQKSQDKENVAARHSTFYSKSEAEPEPSVWDGLQDDSILEMLEDDDDDDEVNDERMNKHSTSTTPTAMNNDNLSSNNAENVSKGGTSDDDSVREMTQVSVHDPEESLQATGTSRGISVFDATDLQGMDLNEFSDDD